MTQRPSDSRDLRLGTAGAAVILVLTLGLGGFAFIWLIGMSPAWIDGFQGVVILIAGFVAVTLSLLMGAVVLTALGMRSKNEALGMPPGSIRALIAIVLILIFAIVGLIVFNAGTNGKTFDSTGLTQVQIDALRADGALVLRQSLQSAAPGSSAAPLYDVTIQTTLSRESHDFGLQLLTTVSTLVVAVAGFYFGSKSTEFAGKWAQANRGAFTPPEVVGAKPDNSIADVGDETADDATANGTPGTVPEGGGAAVTPGPAPATPGDAVAPAPAEGAAPAPAEGAAPAPADGAVPEAPAPAPGGPVVAAVVEGGDAPEPVEDPDDEGDDGGEEPADNV